MPRYFFDFRNGYPHRDETGEELADDRAAWREALKFIREVEDKLAPGGRWFLEVRRQADPIFRIEVNSQWIENGAGDAAGRDAQRPANVGASAREGRL